MRENKFKPIRDRFIGTFERTAEELNTEFSGVNCSVEVHFPPNEDIEAGFFSMYVSCIFRKGGFEGSDNLSLGIVFFDWSSDFKINAEICWGDPSGKLEARAFEEPVDVNDENLTKIQQQLPVLISKLRESIRLNSQTAL